jgi:hypothetical protein
MFGSLRIPRRPGVRRGFAPRVEPLELRDCPSAAPLGLEAFLVPDLGAGIAYPFAPEPAAQADGGTSTTGGISGWEEDPPPPPPPPPAIDEFVSIEGLFNVWTFQGQVDPSLAGLEVVFEGLPTIEGHSVQVEEDGSFSYTITLGPNEEGVVYATITDTLGQESEQVGVLVHPTR